MLLQWVDNLLSHGDRKKAHTWDIRCPYHRCPSNQPFRGANKPRLKFLQKLGLFTYQYHCKDCGCPTTFNIENPNEENQIKRLNPALWGGKADYKFHV